MKAYAAACRRALHRAHTVETNIVHAAEGKIHRHRIILALVTVGSLAAVFLPLVMESYHLPVAVVAATTNLLWIWGTA